MCDKIVSINEFASYVNIISNNIDTYALIMGLLSYVFNNIMIKAPYKACRKIIIRKNINLHPLHPQKLNLNLKILYFLLSKKVVNFTPENKNKLKTLIMEESKLIQH